MIDIEAEQADAEVRITAGAFPTDQPENYMAAPFIHRSSMTSKPEIFWSRNTSGSEH